MSERKHAMKTKTEHTPTPWAIDTDLSAIISPSGQMTARVYGNTTEEFKANAEFIVRACNCHEALLETLCRLLLFLASDDISTSASRSSLGFELEGAHWSGNKKSFMTFPDGKVVLKVWK